MAIASPNSRWFDFRPRRSGASSIDGRSSRMSDDAWTSSIDGGGGHRARGRAAAQLGREERQHRPHALRGRERRVGHRPRHRAAIAGEPAVRAPRSRAPGTRRRTAGPRSSPRVFEHQHVLVLRNVSRDRSARPAARACPMITSGSTRSSIAGPGPPPSFLKSTIPMSPFGFNVLARFRSSTIGCSISWYVSTIRTASTRFREAGIASACRAPS